MQDSKVHIGILSHNSNCLKSSRCAKLAHLHNHLRPSSAVQWKLTWNLVENHTYPIWYCRHRTHLRCGHITFSSEHFAIWVPGWAWWALLACWFSQAVCWWSLLSPHVSGVDRTWGERAQNMPHLVLSAKDFLFHHGIGIAVVVSFTLEDGTSKYWGLKNKPKPHHSVSYKSSRKISCIFH